MLKHHMVYRRKRGQRGGERGRGKRRREFTNTEKWTSLHLSQERRFRIHKNIINSFWGEKLKNKSQIHMSIMWL